MWIRTPSELFQFQHYKETICYRVDLIFVKMCVLFEVLYLNTAIFSWYRHMLLPEQRINPDPRGVIHTDWYIVRANDAS